MSRRIYSEADVWAMPTFCNDANTLVHNLTFEPITRHRLETYG
ncbi:hypothetical protein [Nostoc sp.]